MKLIEMDIYQIEQILRKYEIKDEQSLVEYLKLIQQYKQNATITEGTYCELHHICPKSMFKEHRLSKWNFIRLPFDIHIECHRLLCLFYMNDSCRRAYQFVARHDESERIKFLTSGAFAGDSNPAKREEVREKISKSKKGVSRPDMRGKKFFGASASNIEAGLAKMKEKIANTVIVRDVQGNRFRVSIFDERYISGELVPFNLGVDSKNNSMKRKEVVDKVIDARNKKYDLYKNLSLDEIVDLLIKYHQKGKKLFSNKQPFSSNYSLIVGKTIFTKEEVYNAVVQRLEKV